MVPGGLSQQHAEVVVDSSGLDVSRAKLAFDQLECCKVMLPCVVDLAGGSDQVGELVVSQPAAGVFCQGVLPQSLWGLVDGGLLPGETGEHGDESDRGGFEQQGVDLSFASEVGRGADDQREDAWHGDVLVVVGDERVAEVVDIDESEDGCEREQRVEHCGERCSVEAFASGPHQCGEQGDSGGQGDPEAGLSGLELPERVDECEFEWQERFLEIEPGDGSGGHDAFDQRGVADCIVSDRPDLLEPDFHSAHHDGHDEEGDAADQVGASDSTASPPGQQQEHQRHGDDGAFAEHCQQEGEDGGQVAAWVMCLFEVEELAECNEIEEECEHVFALSDPGD